MPHIHTVWHGYAALVLCMYCFSCIARALNPVSPALTIYSYSVSKSKTPTGSAGFSDSFFTNLGLGTEAGPTYCQLRERVRRSSQRSCVTSIVLSVRLFFIVTMLQNYIPSCMYSTVIRRISLSILSGFISSNSPKCSIKSATAR